MNQNHIFFKGEKIPIEILGDTLVLNKNKKDYPNEINIMLFSTFPQVEIIQHNSHYVEYVHTQECIEYNNKYERNTRGECICKN